jgi:hypothetical protein
VFTDHIAKLPNLIVLCVLAIWLNGKRPTRPCVEINSVAAALTHQCKAQRAEQCLKIPERDRSAALKDLIERFLTAGHANSGDFGNRRRNSLRYCALRILFTVVHEISTGARTIVKQIIPAVLAAQIDVGADEWRAPQGFGDAACFWRLPV